VSARADSPLHIVVDFSAAIHQRAGIGRYTRNLIRAALAQDRANRYTLLHSRASPEAITAATDPLPSNARTLQVPLSPRWFTLLWHRWRVPMPLRSLVGPWDIYHSPDFVLPRVRGGRTIVTVHDLSFLRTPQFAEPGLRRYLAKAVPKAVREADLVLADSAATQADIQELLHVSPAKIQVVHAACDERIRRVTEVGTLQEVQQRLGLPRPYILSLGTLEPRKNFEGLIRAYHALVQAHPDVPHHLVIVGGKGWLYEGIFRARAETGLADRIHILTEVGDEDLPAVYSMADVFTFPSWYEGFGMPPLEAMACGVPVVASPRGSLPEVLGDAALYADPENVEEIAEAMSRLLEDGQVRAALVQRGHKQVQRFSWERSAQDLIALYHSLAGRAGSEGGAQ